MGAGGTPPPEVGERLDDPPAGAETAGPSPRKPPRLFTRSALTCALVATLVALAWSLVTPPFHVPDEPLHFAYVQHLAETGKAPKPGPRPPLSSELTQALGASQFSSVIGNSASGRPPWPGAEQALRAARDAGAPGDDGGGPTGASTQPPAYYALGAIPYLLADAAGADLIEKIHAVRLLSVLLCGLTVLLVFSFLRDLLPRTTLAAPAGALAVAFQPMFGFVGSGVTADSLLFAVSAGVFALLARSFRFGATPRRVVALGALLALGSLTKLTFAGIVPGALLGMLVLAARMERGEARRALAGAMAAFVAPLLAYVAVSRLAWDRSVFEPAGTSAITTGREPTTKGTISYLVQFYLPRPPFLSDQIDGKFAVFDIWFRQFVGRFGWLDYSFREPVTWTALAIWGVLLAFVGRALMAGRAGLRSRPRSCCWRLPPAWACCSAANGKPQRSSGPLRSCSSACRSPARSPAGSAGDRRAPT